MSVFGNLIENLIIPVAVSCHDISIRFMMMMICDDGVDLGNAKNVESRGMLPSAVHVAYVAIGVLP